MSSVNSVFCQQAAGHQQPEGHSQALGRQQPQAFAGHRPPTARRPENKSPFVLDADTYHLPLRLQHHIMLTGTVKFFNETKGFGFIKDEETGTEYFVHVTGLVDKVRENDKVTFDLKEGRKGMNAVSVKLA